MKLLSKLARSAAVCVLAAAVAMGHFGAAGMQVRAQNWDLDLPSLAEAFADHFLFGNIWSNRGQMGDEATFAKYLHHYNTITASNNHKVDAVLGAAANAWNWNWDIADEIVDMATDNDMAMVWHTLVWHNQSRPWLTNIPGTTDVITRAEAIENMHRFISTVTARYSGRIAVYDVVNEAITAINWTQHPDWRLHARRMGQGLPDDDPSRTLWYDAFANGAVGDECGSDYIYYAFRFARIYDPFAVLYYNDYNEWDSNKREAIAAMVESINERWTHDPLYDGRLLIEGIGMQSHINLRNWPGAVSAVERALVRFAETGARVSVTELNVYLEGGGINPAITANLPTYFEEQAVRYRQLFDIYTRLSHYLDRVTFFIWQDLPAQQGAWRRWPHSQHPALFDLDRVAKPAFHAVLEALYYSAPVRFAEPFVLTDIRQSDHGDRQAVQFLAYEPSRAPMLWSVTAGALPAGMELVPATGVIMGNPTQNGSFTFTVAATNSAGYGEREFTLDIANRVVSAVHAAEYPTEKPQLPPLPEPDPTDEVAAAPAPIVAAPPPVTPETLAQAAAAQIAEATLAEDADVPEDPDDSADYPAQNDAPGAGPVVWLAYGGIMVFVAGVMVVRTKMAGKPKKE